jgi:energy-coupling factor transport system permease protein
MGAFRQHHSSPEYRASTARVNAAAWGLWFCAVAVIPLVTRNPLYLVLALLVVLAVYVSLPKRRGAARAWRLFVIVGASLALVSVLFNVLTVHIGDRAFARLPEDWPIVGGPLTWNALVYGLLSATAIATLLLAAATFNTVVRQGDVIRLLPGSFTSLGVAGSVAVTAVPGTIAAAHDIYDAQRARGQQFRGPRAATGLVLPLLGSGLERALTLAEALETRGFGASAAGKDVPPARPSRGAAPLAPSPPGDHPRQGQQAPGDPRLRPITIVPVAFLTTALALLGTGRVWVGLVMLGIALWVALRLGRERQERTHFRPLEWNVASSFVAGASLASGVGLLLGPALTGGTLAYDTFPRLSAPPFEPLLGAATLLLLAPLWWQVTEPDT